MRKLFCLWLQLLAYRGGAGGEVELTIAAADSAAEPRADTAAIVRAIASAEPRAFASDESSEVHPEIFAVHWVHIPKAAGSAFTRMVKRVACEMNPELRGSNPCCQAELCLSVSCATSTSGCPIVPGIGRHTSNMALMDLLPCCGRAWARGTVGGFMSFAFPDDPFTKPFLIQARAALELWPLTRRAEFLLRGGVTRAELKRHLARVAKRGSYDPEAYAQVEASLAAWRASDSPDTGEAPPSELRTPDRLRSEAQRVDAREYTEAVRLGRNADTCAQMTRLHPQAADARGQDDFACARGANAMPGSHSITVLRHPFERGISSAFYRGHNPVSPTPSRAI